MSILLFPQYITETISFVNVLITQDTRSIFELLIGIATQKNGSMRDRISSISFMDGNEKDDLQKLWNELNAWAHPYGKWFKNICPMFYGFGRNHHPEMFNKCMEYSDKILDFMLTITIDHFKISALDFIDEFIANDNNK
jgi:hypothetical protein